MSSVAARWETAMPKVDIAAVPERKGSGYPLPFDAPCAERIRQRLKIARSNSNFCSFTSPSCSLTWE
jgi:hypothetical protein